MKTEIALLEQRITLKQGAGGRAMRALIEGTFLGAHGKNREARSPDREK